ncbi:aminotransferase class III-fold pyridoxal phosphate-dependent enzyme [Pseudonocardia alni]|uniref:aminotransferase class III-fold pyridoxal phosphate-dependent enzyme n=1 Tax=Pseudonocardia alni TaxID=33907 RepID=UPI0033E164C8
MTATAHAAALLPCAPGPLPTVSHGEGVFLYDVDGRGYLDGSSGAVAANLGHGNAPIADALYGQASRVAFAHRTQWQAPPVTELAELIAARTPGALDRVLFLSGGSEANEAAMRFALAHHRAHGRPERTGFLSRRTSYHGSTLGALSLTGQGGRRAGVEGLLHPFPALHPAGGALPDADGLRAELARTDPTGLAAVVTEPVGGASGAALVPGPGYHAVLREWCTANDVLWIADEVMAGMGRTGRWFAVEHDGVVPDLLVLGKGISGGYAPLSAVVVDSGVADAVLDDLGHVSFGHTYSNSPLTCAVGVAVVGEMERLDLVGNAGRQGGLLAELLTGLAARHAVVHEHRGRGLLRGVELRDPATGDPFPDAGRATREVLRAARDQGLLLYPAAQGMYGGRGDGFLVAPPLTITGSEIRELVARLDRALTAVGSRRPRLARTPFPTT